MKAGISRRTRRSVHGFKGFARDCRGHVLTACPQIAKEERAGLMAEIAGWDHALDPNFWRARVRFCFGAPDLAERGQFQNQNDLVPGPPNVEPVAGPSRKWVPIQPPPKKKPLPPKKAARKVEVVVGPADHRAIVPPIPLDNIQIRFTQPTNKFYVGHLPQREVAALPGRQVTEVPLKTRGEPGEVPDLRIRTEGPANSRARQCN
ncbi:unnamed protein product [Allacma fusca]|uniref:Uncharacterized protein n=1 Tax=Allacma fusca TaxID=39272 RepID=A0A8J2L5Q9_9HEXA|nr:unnamed protein product [Allacma fusca]